MPPVVYLLCGLTGSGKTTYAKRLEAAGAVRLTVDEEVHARHGRYGVDYPTAEYFGLVFAYHVTAWLALAYIEC